MKKILFLIIATCFFKTSHAAWINLNTGINDNLTGVAFWGNNGLVSGDHGLYTTAGSGTWTRFNINGNSGDSVIYNRIKFSHAYTEGISVGYNKVFACGYDTVAGKAIIMQVDLATMAYSFIYTGLANTRLNKMTYSPIGNSYYAVGDNGLIVRFTAGSSAIISTTFNYNLASISFSGSDFTIGSNGTLINGSLDVSNNLSFRIFPAPGYDFKGVLSTGYNYNYGVGNGYYKSIGTSPIDQSNFDFGPLNANALQYYSPGNIHFVGTDHGIFKSDNARSFLEWQPSSGYSTINGFCYNSSVVYACGKNGVLLSTTDQGGITKPYARLNLPGGCLGTNVLIGGITGTQTYCEWFINNVQVSWTCGSFNHVFNTAGQYTIQVNVANSSNLYDTAVQVINIVAYPKINKPVSISKSILCHQEPIVIAVDSSQQNVFYTLKMIGNSNSYGSSGIGNQSPVNFTSAPLSVAGNYYLQANSSIAACYKNFTDTIKISVEKTLATFHLATINANPGEQVNCFQHCNDAQNFKWTFSPNASIPTSTVQTPSVSFSSVGSTQIKLVAWSNNGCYDSIQKPGPAIYNEPVNDDSCWTILNRAIDPPYEGHYDPEISQLSKSASGFLTCGIYYKQTFASRFGDSLKIVGDSGGAYIAKYNKNGVLKWMSSSHQYIFPGQSSRERIKTVIEDKTGNIYFAGYSGIFFDNTGVSSSYPFLGKLDSSGKFLWIMGGVAATSLYVDNSNNLIALTQSFSSGSTTVTLNGVPVYTLTNSSMPVANQLMIKIRPNGMPVWYTQQFRNGGVNGSSNIANISSDKSGNLYLTGVYQYGTANLYSAGSSTFTSVPASSPNSGTKLYLAKYDSLGQLKWFIRSYATNLSPAVKPYWIATDSIGNSYISGENSTIANSVLQVVDNADGTTSSYNAGCFFIMKVSPGGICKWVNGTKYSYYGTGYAVCLHDSEISVLGMMANNSATLQTSVFTSQNNINASLSINGKDYFIAVYDTLGNIKRIITNGNNPLTPGYNDQFTGFYNDGPGIFYLGRNSGFAGNYMNFGDALPATTGMDGMVTRFSENCGIITYPDIATGLNNEQKEKITVFPNPSKNLLYIAGLGTTGKYRTDLINTMGQAVITCVDREIINVEQLTTGMYFLLIYKDNKLYHQEKIIKE